MRPLEAIKITKAAKKTHTGPQNKAKKAPRRFPGGPKKAPRRPKKGPRGPRRPKMSLK